MLRLEGESRGGADISVDLQKEAVLIVIKLTYLGDEELGATLPAIKLGCLGWSLSKLCVQQSEQTHVRNLGWWQGHGRAL